ncbi:serine/threonine-protein kinase [Nocardia otitidiscaviarum]|uniref:serine/threonine-protein kinase n=1 Tax=Nocardia otitidiscaviarum TaxID=1823 RepID=UPI0004A77D91|nr:serine/threonine-protein kinase [Nocardia otitidiscaviarum]
MDADDEHSYGGYRVERTLGSGGMGTVYLAQHPRLPRKDALKVLADRYRDDEGFRARFLREADIAARLQHPNLVAVRDRGEHNGRLWIAMQYVAGIDAAELVRRGPVEPSRAVWILTEAAHGLDEVHRAGLLHRDVKPANILIASPVDGPERVLVTDFGIARPADDSATLDGSGGFAATLSYAAPEQINGEPVDRRTDVYALGCTLYQLLTGSVPFPRDSTAAVMYAHLNEAPPKPSAANPFVPAELDGVIATALAKDPAQRYPSCGGLAAAALQAVTAGVTRSKRRRPALIALAAITLIGAAAAAVSFALPDSDDPSTTARSHLPNTTSVDPANWGEYAFIVQAFPALLPPAPGAVGYQQTTNCIPTEFRNVGTMASLDQKPQVGVLLCQGDRDPVYILEATCNADGSAVLPNRSLIDQLEGDESWSRSTGSGHLFWGTAHYRANLANPVLSGRTLGILEVYFEDSNRNHCYLTVTGESDGTSIRDRWWPQAPL